MLKGIIHVNLSLHLRSSVSIVWHTFLIKHNNSSFTLSFHLFIQVSYKHNSFYLQFGPLTAPVNQPLLAYMSWNMVQAWHQNGGCKAKELLQGSAAPYACLLQTAPPKAIMHCPKYAVHPKLSNTSEGLPIEMQISWSESHPSIYRDPGSLLHSEKWVV